MERKKIALLAVLVCILVSGSLTSCDKDERTIPSHQEEGIASKSEGNDLRSESLRARLDVVPSQALRGTNFRFVVWISGQNPQNKKAALRFECPDGVTRTFDMQTNGYDVEMAFFVLNRSLSQYGEYRVSAYEKVGNGYYNLFCSERVFVLHPPIPMGDNYSSLHVGKGVMYPRNCTAWVTGKVNEMWNANSFQNLIDNPRDAKHWKNHLVAKGYKADGNPRVGDIAFWEANIKGCSGSLGHVAFVNNVSSDGNTVYITEYNFPSGERYGTRTLKRYGARKPSEQFPIAFIHVQTRRN